MSSATEQPDTLWGDPDQLVTVARNVGTRYLTILTDAVIGLMILPFNVHHLGQAAYGLWMLTASVTAYFSILDLGYGGSLVKFVAQYRAMRDARGLNEILSTLFLLLAGVGIVAYAVFATVAFHLGSLFNLGPEEIATGRALLLLIGVYVSLGFPFSIFGGVINGFQRYDLNNIVGIGSSVSVAVVNVAVLSTGHGLVTLVAATTTVRLLAYIVYRLNAYRVFRPLSLRISLFRLSRLREVTGFSVYMLLIDWANKVNYSIDAMVIGAFLSSTAVALWTVPQRLAMTLQRLTNQINGVLMPVIVDCDALGRDERLRAIFVQGTRLSLVAVLPLAACVALLAGPLIHAWVGPAFAESVVVTQILAAVVAFRVGNATANMVLKGAGRHRLLARTNVSAAAANLALSLLWIRRYGLVGQAMGTLVPVASVTMMVLWPAACRRVGLGVAAAFRTAVWPTLWPLAVMAAVVLPIRDVLPERLLAVAAACAAGVACYLTTFLAFGVTRAERRAYVAKAIELIRRRRRLMAAA